MRAGKLLVRFFYVLMGVLFLPVIASVFFVGNHMQYNKYNKINALLPNYVFLGVALVGFAFICLLAWIFRRTCLTRRVNWAVNGVLAVLFLLLFFVNVYIAREIAFRFPWDIMVVTAGAKDLAGGNTLGYSVYFSMYTNNIPILHILKGIYSKAAESGNPSYINEFVWIQISCALISIGGFFSCLTVKRLTRQLVPTFIAFFLYLALPGITPWKIAPYTDTYGIVFPVMCLYFYLCYREAQRPILKYLSVAAALIVGMLGGLVKPSEYIVVIAILVVELVGWLAGDWKRWRYILAEVGLVAVLFLAKGACMEHMMEEMGLEFNPELEAGWQNYFYMGLNEEYTGSYCADDVAMFGEFQYSREERTNAALERALGRIEERGFWGSVYFCLKKMVMVFNDGTFGWQSEVWIHEHYPPNLASNTGRMDLLRSIFWPDSLYSGRFNAFCQLAWIFCLLGIAGSCFCPGGQREKHAILAVVFLGIFCYQLLFEARARYLFVFLPVLIATSICGMWQWVCRIHGWIDKWKNEKRIEDERQDMKECA